MVHEIESVVVYVTNVYLIDNKVQKLNSKVMFKMKLNDNVYFLF